MHHVTIAIGHTDDTVTLTATRHSILSYSKFEQCQNAILTALKKAKISPTSFGSSTAERSWSIRMRFNTDEITAEQAVAVVKAALKADGISAQVR